jgi:ribosomal protein S18 acetylase RimI-like enzyme
MSSAGIEIRPANPDDLDDVAALHRVMFHDHFLGQFPARIISRFYESFLRDALFIVARDDEGQLLGFVMGGRTEALDQARESCLQHTRFALAGHILSSPRLWPQAWQRVAARFASPAERPASVSTTTHRLLSIAVAGASQGRGVAKSLVNAFESGLKDADEYGLSVEANNDRAIAFYQKMGMRIDGQWGGSVFFRKRLDHLTDQGKGDS